MTARIEIVHERWNELGGSESVVRALADEWPEASVRVALADPALVPPQLRGRLRVTPLDRLFQGTGRRSHLPLLPLVPVAMRSLRPGPADAVIISHHATALAAAGAYARRGVPVIAYVHSPARWAWNPALRAQEAGGAVGGLALTALAAEVRAVERAAVPHLSVAVANSTAVADRIRLWWGRDAVVVPPPVDVHRFTPGDPRAVGHYFLVAGRLVPYRRVDLAVRAAQRAGVRLVVAGSGRHESELRAVAGPETTFLGRVGDERMVELQRGAIATLMPGEEDFGIIPVEAMACGTPVIARGIGGALDTVLPGVTGMLFDDAADEPATEQLAELLRGFRAADFDPMALRAWSERFSTEAFRRRMRALVEEVTNR